MILTFIISVWIFTLILAGFMGYHLGKDVREWESIDRIEKDNR